LHGDWLMNRSILIIAAHADDEALGCSGTIFRHVDNGDSVHLLLMTDGVSSRYVAGDEIQVRLNSLQDAAEAMGISTFKTLSFPDNKMDSIPLLEIIKEIEKAIMNLQPEVIYTHHIGDLNVDHQVTHKAVITACRPQPDFCVKEIYAFEVLSSTEWQTPGVESFNPNVFVDITDYIDIKKQVLEVYSEEMRQPPHSRSIDNALRLNALRGNSVGVDYAEAFELIRMIR
jgi:N-acetylglucosamine malate deacetylase 1